MKILFKNATVITPSGSYKRRWDVAVEEKKILAVAEEIEGDFDRIINAEGKLLTPAFYNIHCHSAMTLFRGIGDDLPLNSWLETKIYPAEDRLTPKAVRIGTELAAAEMIRAGVVSFSDMYFFSEETAKAVGDLGMKANIARSLVSFDENDSIKNNTRFSEAEALYKEFNHAFDGRIIVDMSVHAEYTNKERYLREVAEYSMENDIGMQVHLSETALEHDECRERHGGRTPVEFLRDCGILTPKKTRGATAAHCVWVTERDISILAENGVTVAHNPVSNLKLASGVAPVEKLLAGGVNVGLGTDGAASNNALSILRELQTAALIHRGVNYRADLIKTPDICKMGWENGAKAQGRHDCGRIEAGCRADIILIDLDEINNIPMYDPYSAIAFSVDSKDVCLTMADGKILYENGEYTTLDVEKLRREAKDTIAHYFDEN